MTGRVAIYARYSSDRQSERSIEDQLAVCSRHAAAKGWSVVEVFSDAAISGAAMVNRPGLNAALAAAAEGRFDILLAEDEDRLARNLEHQAHVFNRLRHLGVAIATLHSDAIGILEVGLKGVMNELYLENLSAKTKRGMASNAEKGLATGSRLYGYRSQPGGAIEPVEAEANVVRRIFREWVDGANARQIAHGLNRDGVPGPRGGPWSPSTINGNRKRGTGILWSEIYAGVKTYGRVLEKKDRATGQRRVVCAPRDAWKRVPVPHLQIVDDAVWQAAQARKEAEHQARPHELVRRPGLLTGLLKCRCGASFTQLTGDRMGCSAAREKGAAVCTNRRTLGKAAVETRVLEGLQAQLLHPDLVKAYLEEYRWRRRELRAQAVGRRAPLERKVQQLERLAERLVDDYLALDKGHPLAVRLKDRIAAADADLKAAQAELASVPDASAADQPIELHPKAAETYRRQVAELQAYLVDAAAKTATPAKQSLVEAARGLIDRIEVHPTSDEYAAPVDLVLYGDLSRFIRGGEAVRAATDCMSVVVVGGVCHQRHTPEPVAIRIRLAPYGR